MSPHRTTRTFDGHILGLGTATGHRFVVGVWRSGPFGVFSDVMVETPDGHRILLAPRADVAEFVAGTYTFDEVRIEPVEAVRGAGWTVRSPSLTLTATVGRRLALAHALRAVPGGIRRTEGWARAVDPLARRLMPGVRTHGSAGGGRTEWYAARDVRRLSSAEVVWEGVPLGGLRPVLPPVRFGFASAPATPTETTLSSHVAGP